MAACGGSRPGRSWSGDVTSSAVRERRSALVAVGHQLAHLPRVEQPGPPVEPDTPDGERPSEDLGEGGDGPLPVAQEQQRERVEQGRRRGLAQVVDREGGVAPRPQERHQSPEEDVAEGQDDGDPPRNDVPVEQADDGGEDVEAGREPGGGLCPRWDLGYAKGAKYP